MNTEMQQKTTENRMDQEVTESSPTMNVLVNFEKSCRSRAVFRLLVNMHGPPKPDVNLADDYRALSAIHPICEGHHQEENCANTQEHSSRETKKQMNDTVIPTPTKHMEADNVQSESPSRQQEQSLLKRAIRVLLIFFFIFGVIVFSMVASQFVYLENLGKCMNELVNQGSAGKYNPPV